MSEVAETLEGLPRGFRLMSPDRTFVREGPLFKISNGHTQERHFILFDDLVLYGTRSLLRPGKIQFKGKILLDRVLVRTLSDTDATQHAFELVRVDSKKKKYIIFGRNDEERDEWVQDIHNRTIFCRRRASQAISKSTIQRAIRTGSALQEDPSMGIKENPRRNTDEKQIAPLQAQLQKLYEMTPLMSQDKLEEHLLVVGTFEHELQELEELVKRH